MTTTRGASGLERKSPRGCPDSTTSVWSGVLGQVFQVPFDEEVLHPVLTHLPRLAVGDQLVGVERHVEVQVVVDHHLEGAPLRRAPPVLADGFAPQFALGAEAVAVDAAPGAQLLQKLRRKLPMKALRDVAQRVGQGQHRLLLVQGVPPVRRAYGRIS